MKLPEADEEIISSQVQLLDGERFLITTTIRRLPPAHAGYETQDMQPERCRHQNTHNMACDDCGMTFD